MSSAKSIKNPDKMKEALSIAMTLLYTWMIYKLPLIVHSYALVEYQEYIAIKIILPFMLFVILLITDVLVFVFLYEYYQ